MDWDKISTERVTPEKENLCAFSVKMVDILVEEAVRALQVPNHAGLNYAAHLLQDALKYHALDDRVKVVSDVSLYEAVEKLNGKQSIKSTNYPL